MPNKVTLQDIADALNLSRNTVSKAINNTGILAEETKNKVLQKAFEMGYKQFSYANTIDELIQTDNQKKTKGEIALFLGTFLKTSHFASTMLDKFQNELSILGYTMTMHRVTKENILEKTLPSSYNPNNTKAIVCVEIFDQEYSEFLCSKDVPVLMIDAPVETVWKPLNADILLMNNFTNIFTLVSDMKKRGITEIGFIGEDTHCRSFFERYIAFRDAMHVNNLPINEDFCITKLHTKKNKFDNYFGENYKQMLSDKISSLEKLPQLFICANDFVAIDFINILKDHNIQYPEDIKIFGFDDSSESKIISPALSTCHIHSQSIGYSAVNMVITRINQPSLDYRITYVNTDLIYRESTN